MHWIRRATVRRRQFPKTTGKGRHTTTSAQIFRIGPDTFVADTPGMRARHERVSPNDLDRYFPGSGQCWVRAITGLPFGRARLLDYRGCRTRRHSKRPVRELLCTAYWYAGLTKLAVALVPERAPAAQPVRIVAKNHCSAG